MGNITLLSMNVVYGLAVILFISAVILLKLPFKIADSSPPRLPFGKVAVWPYQWSDLFGVLGIGGFFYIAAIGMAMIAEESVARPMTVPDLIAGIAVQFFLATVAVVIMVRRIRPVAWLGLAWKQWPFVFLLAPAVVVSMWTVFAILYELGYMELLQRMGVEQVQETVALFQESDDIAVIVLMAFTASVVAPICEEIVFRGYLYPVMKKFSGLWIAALCNALIFSAAHGNMSALLPLFIFGLALVALYEYTGSIWAPIATHFLFNSATVCIQLMVRFGYIPEAALQ